MDPVAANCSRFKDNHCWLGAYGYYWFNLFRWLSDLFFEVVLVKPHLVKKNRDKTKLMLSPCFASVYLIGCRSLNKHRRLGATITPPSYDYRKVAFQYTCRTPSSFDSMILQKAVFISEWFHVSKSFVVLISGNLGMYHLA